MATARKQVELDFPRLPFKNWVVLGIDLSLSRTGYAVLHLEDGVARWGDIGSFTPRNTSDETWARGAAIANSIKAKLNLIVRELRDRGIFDQTAIILAIEFPDPNNSHLMALNGVVQTVLWRSAPDAFFVTFPTYRLAINASTLRATLRLTGTSDKAANKELAYQYVPVAEYPNLDTDNCDAALLAMMGRHAAMILGGHEDLVPQKPLVTLCSQEMKVKVSSRTDKKTGEVKVTKKETARAILHNPGTWTLMASPIQVVVGQSNARSTTRATPTTVLL